MKIRDATAHYEAWLGRQLTLVEPDLALKHREMRNALFPFFRATFYRWAQLWPTATGDLATAPPVLAVGDLHVENFGTWRDAEGRLVWGVNDFDEAWHLPYTNDLVRLAASVHVAIGEHELSLDAGTAVEAILEGYGESLISGGKSFVLAEKHRALRRMAVERLHEPDEYWEKLRNLPDWTGPVPRGAGAALARVLPRADLPVRYVHRVAGLGSLGRIRVVALADWCGGAIAREAKALAPSACHWAAGGEGTATILYPEIVDRAVRAPDPFLNLGDGWVARRLAPDCSRIELTALPKERDEGRLLYAMGWETANIHLGSGIAPTLLADLKSRPKNWLSSAAKWMAAQVEQDWQDWRKQSS